MPNVQHTITRHPRNASVYDLAPGRIMLSTGSSGRQCKTIRRPLDCLTHQFPAGDGVTLPAGGKMQHARAACAATGDPRCRLSSSSVLPLLQHAGPWSRPAWHRMVTNSVRRELPSGKINDCGKRYGGKRHMQLVEKSYSHTAASANAPQAAQKPHSQVIDLKH